MSAMACCSVHSTTIWRGEQADRPDALGEGAGFEMGRQQAGRQEVDAVARPPADELRGRATWAMRASVASTTNSVEVDRSLGDEGRVHDRADRLRQHRHVRPEEALPLVGLHRPEVHDRLELDVVVLFEGEEVVEDLALGDLGRLVHRRSDRPARRSGRPCPNAATYRSDAGSDGVDVAHSVGRRLGQGATRAPPVRSAASASTHQPESGHSMMRACGRRPEQCARRAGCHGTKEDARPPPVEHDRTARWFLFTFGPRGGHLGRETGPVNRGLRKSRSRVRRHRRLYLHRKYWVTQPSVPYDIPAWL